MFLRQIHHRHRSTDYASRVSASISRAVTFKFMYLHLGVDYFISFHFILVRFHSISLIHSFIHWHHNVGQQHYSIYDYHNHHYYYHHLYKYVCRLFFYFHFVCQLRWNWKFSLSTTTYIQTSISICVFIKIRYMNRYELQLNFQKSFNRLQWINLLFISQTAIRHTSNFVWSSLKHNFILS